jgi:hypothetical protein
MTDVADMGTEQKAETCSVMGCAVKETRTSYGSEDGCFVAADKAGGCCFGGLASQSHRIAVHQQGDYLFRELHEGDGGGARVDGDRLG